MSADAVYHVKKLLAVSNDIALVFLRASAIDVGCALSVANAAKGNSLKVLRSPIPVTESVGDPNARGEAEKQLARLQSIHGRLLEAAPDAMVAVNQGGDMPDLDGLQFKRLRMCCEASAIAVATVGCLVLYGWVFQISLLKSVLPGLVEMKVNTALGLIFSGISLWLLLPGEQRMRRRHVARFLALLVTLIGAATLSEYLFGVNLRIDELLFSAPVHAVATSSPGRMASSTAVAYLEIGLALLLLDWETRRGHRPAQLLSLLVALVAIIAISGYIYNVPALYSSLQDAQIALNTAIALFVLSGAVFFARPRSGIAADLTGEGSGSAMARRFLPAVFCVPIFLGWIRLKGQQARYYGTEFGLALFATANIIAFAVLVWLNARTLNEEHNRRNMAEIKARELNEKLEGRVAERTEAVVRQAAILAEQAALLDLAQDAIIVRDMQNRIVFWNRGAATMFGWSSEEALGKNKFELLTAEFIEPLENIQVNLLNQGRWEGELVHHARDGTPLTVAAHWALQRDGNGAPLRILAICNDITVRKKMERLKDEFVSSVSHELRTPLTSISASLSLLTAKAAGTLPDPAVRLLTIAYTNSQRLVRLVNDILDIEKMEAGQVIFNFRRVEVRSLVDEAVDANRGFAEACGVRIRLLDDGCACDDVRADPDRLAQVVTNLLSNAIKFSPPDSEVEVAVENGTDMIRISVRDQGPGIAADFKPRIFERFAQADATNARLRGGTGLGLSIVKQIVDRLGGEVGFADAATGGTIFHIVLPSWKDGDSEATDSEAQLGALKQMYRQSDLETAVVLREPFPTIARASKQG